MATLVFSFCDDLSNDNQHKCKSQTTKVNKAKSLAAQEKRHKQSPPTRAPNPLKQGHTTQEEVN
jgi:hypothetical protein